MPSNSEMYDRGAHDAVHDELNPFYYQHYYYYRRGYNDARRRERRTGGISLVPLLLLLLALAVAGGAWWALERVRVPAEAQAPPAPTLAPTLAPTPPPPTAAPTAVPTVAPPTLAIGGRARIVNLNGAPLRARETAGLEARVVARIPEGSEVTLREGPVEADGYTWWRVEAEGAAGWVAGSSAEGAQFLEVVP